MNCWLGIMDVIPSQFLHRFLLGKLHLHIYLLIRGGGEEQ